jgi:hypothetical protein
VRWRDCENCLPHNTLSTLPLNGMIVTVTHVRELPAVAKRRIVWPPRVRASEVSGGMEGVPSRYGVYQLFARLPSGDEVMVWAYFGQAHPTNLQLAAVNARLRSVRLS